MRVFPLSLLVLAVMLAGCASPAVPTPESVVPSQASATAVGGTATPESTATTQPQPSPTISSTLEFGGEQAMALAQHQCDIGPRPTGSEALITTRDWIEAQLQAQGWQTVRQDFEYQAQGGQARLPVHNVVGIKGEGPALLIGAHFDTRPQADQDPNQPQQPIIGGNDGASGVAVLLELARTIDIPPGRQVQLAFFDAEDRGGIDNWPFSVGAAHMAENLPGARPEAVVVVDMIGDADQQIFRERNSNIEINNQIFAIAARLGYEGQTEGFINQPKWTIIDDHLPFISQGIPAIDLIDFDYPAWHTLDDTCQQLGALSLERVGRVLEFWLEQPVGQGYLPLVKKEG
jgi:glutaminyl-peptide cyclotransferase